MPEKAIEKSETIVEVSTPHVGLRQDGDGSKPQPFQGRSNVVSTTQNSSAKSVIHTVGVVGDQRKRKRNRKRKKTNTDTVQQPSVTKTVFTSVQSAQKPATSSLIKPESGTIHLGQSVKFD